jgi:hypothetical protein
MDWIRHEARFEGIFEGEKWDEWDRRKGSSFQTRPDMEETGCIRTEEPKCIDTGKWSRKKREWNIWEGEEVQGRKWWEEPASTETEWEREWREAEKGWDGWKPEEAPSRINERKDDTTKKIEGSMGKPEPKWSRKRTRLGEEEETWRRKDREDKDGDERDELRDRQEWLEACPMETVITSKEVQEDTDEPQERPAWI